MMFMKREDVRGGVERLCSLGEKAQHLEERFPRDDPLSIWAQETKDMLGSFANGRQRGPATFLDPIESLLHELLKRGMKKEAKPFARLIQEVVQEISRCSINTPGWGLGVTGGVDVKKHQGSEEGGDY